MDHKITYFTYHELKFLFEDACSSLMLTEYVKGKLEIQRDARNSMSENMTNSGENVSTLEQMQVPNWTRPGVRRSKRPLLASHTLCNVLWKHMLLTYV